MLDKQQLRMDPPPWYSDAPRPAPTMLDEQQRTPRIVQRPTDARGGCLAPAALMVVLWAACAGLAFGQTFALQPGNEQALRPLGQRGSTRITEAELKKVDGLTIRIRPEWISDTDRNVLDFKFVDENVALCRKLGKRYTLLVMGGGDRPLDPWSFLWYQHAAGELGKRYAADPLCYAAHVTGGSPPGHSEELFWRSLTPQGINVNKGLIEAWAKAFPKQLILFAGAASDQKAMRELIRHGVAVAPGRFIYKINSLSAKTTTTGWAGTDLVVEAAKAGAGIGFEMLCGSNESRFGGSWSQAMAKKMAIEKRAGKQTSYLAVYRGDLAKVGAK